VAKAASAMPTEDELRSAADFAGVAHFDHLHRADLCRLGLIIPVLGGDTTQWWKLATIISCGTLAGAIIPELVKVFTSTESAT
jgi:hypothetical protein